MVIIPRSATITFTFDGRPLDDTIRLLTEIRDAMDAKSPDDLVVCTRCYGSSANGTLTCLSCNGTGVVPRYVAEKIIQDRGERA